MLESLLLSRLKSCTQAARRDAGAPDALPGAVMFEGQAQDGLRVSGWSYRPEQAQGTLFLTHGFARNCVVDHIPSLACEVSSALRLATVTLDFRLHGASGDRLPTFGTAESWDLAAALDYAEAENFPRPWILHGVSLGAMACGRLAMTDERVYGAALVCPPGWPFDAIGKMADFFVPQKGLQPVRGVLTVGVGNAINRCYGWDILADGDLSHHWQKRESDPPLLYWLIGDEDHFDASQAEAVFEKVSQGRGHRVGDNVWEATDNHAWYHCVPGCVHPGYDGHSILDWEGYNPAIYAFLALCIDRYKKNTVETADKSGENMLLPERLESPDRGDEPCVIHRRSENMSTSVQKKFGAKIRGVNLGGWLVLEKWMTPSLFEGLQATDETTYCVELGGKAQDRLQNHWRTFVTEADFAWLAEHGINAVRIPLGHWIFGAPYPYHPKFEGNPTPFVEGGIEILDQAFAWAEKHGLFIQLDLHAAPGCQNGSDHGGMLGVCAWHGNAEYVECSLGVLERLAERYGCRKALQAIEVLNEPSWDIPPEFLREYTRQAYGRIRRHCAASEVAVVFHDGFRGYSEYRNFLQPPEYENVVLDLHRYQCFDDGDRGMDIYGHIKKAAIDWTNESHEIAEHLGLWTYVGEWSLGLHPTTFAIRGQGPSGFCHREMDDFQQNLAYRAYGAAQLVTFEKHLGWYFWSYKTESAPAWSFRDCVELGWLPASYDGPPDLKEGT